MDMHVKVLGILHANIYPYFLSIYSMPDIVQGSMIIVMKLNSFGLYKITV